MHGEDDEGGVEVCLGWDSVDREVYMKNAGDYGVVLSLLTDEWDPVNAAEHMGVSWDYDGGFLEAGAIMEIVLTLTVDASPPVLGGFSFDIVFVAWCLDRV